MEIFEIPISGTVVNCVVKRRLFARTVRLKVGREGQVSISAPRFLSEAHMRDFIAKHEHWLEKTLEKIRARAKTGSSLHVLLEDENIGSLCEKYMRSFAQVYFTLRTVSLNKRHYGFPYGKITIKDQKTRFGSCSTKGNLNFNYRVILSSVEAIDYLILHELCHLREMNHGKKFYDLLSKSCPEYRRIRKQLREGK